MATDDLASAVLDTLPTAVAVLDSDGTVLRLNQAWRHSAATAIALAPIRPGGSLLAACEAASDRLPHLDRLAAMTRQLLDNRRDQATMEVSYSGPHGLRWLDVRLRPLAGGRGLVIMVDDVTERHEIENRLRHHATHDLVTGLANRLAVTERLAALANEPASGHDDHPAALFFLDLDAFRNINNTFGYRTGDAVLRAVADRLGSALRPTDLAARWGGDEFVVVASHLTSTDAAALAEQLTQTLTEPLHVDGHQIRMSASIGIALSVARPDVPDRIDRVDGPRRSAHGLFEAPSSGDAVALVQLASEVLVRSRAQAQHRRRPRPRS